MRWSRLEKSLDLVDYSAKLRELDKKLSEIGAELSKLKAAEEVLVKIKDFSLPLSLLTERHRST